ncbi:SET and MYND domain-containing protein 5 [Frankliniella fusca]|uniref:Protein-lysine N-trimethyltransferase SMYD5 n=1 Tax=Frankliniella fusca TaxID=407009 RepID=A0AAE1HE04_9NEOP|nr:SET and MYND domain-containing protein 5 [Frankliniella fusca]
MMSPLGVEVRYVDDMKGKGLFAVRAFKAGEIVFEEQPLVCCQFAWNQAYGYLSCDYCMRPLESAEENARRLSGKPELVLPYPQCCVTAKNQHTECGACGVRYCSVSCLEQAWAKYHRTLCTQARTRDASLGQHPLDMLNDAWKQMHYPPETTSIMLLARIIAMIHQENDKERIMHTFMQFCHRVVNHEDEIAHKLLGEQFQGQLEMLRTLILQALPSDNASHNWLTPEGFRSLVALVGTNGQGVGTSSLSEWVKKVSALSLAPPDKQALDVFINKLYDDLEEVVGSFLNCEGSALYSLQSSCNHSCIPNAEPSFPYSDFRLVMTATRNIQPGDEITISYLDECTLERSRHSRLKMLRENYLFNCQCIKCEAQAGDPDITSDDEGDNDSEEDLMDDECVENGATNMGVNPPQ